MGSPSLFTSSFGQEGGGLRGILTNKTAGSAGDSRIRMMRSVIGGHSVANNCRFNGQVRLNFWTSYKSELIKQFIYNLNFRWHLFKPKNELKTLFLLLNACCGYRWLKPYKDSSSYQIGLITCHFLKISQPASFEVNL